MKVNTSVILSSTLISIFVFSAGLTAQEKSELALGARVRVSASKYFLKASEGPINLRRELRPIGTLQFFGSDTLIIEAEDSGQILVIPRSHLKKLEVSSGHQSQIGKGALFGFVIGAGIGAAITNSNFTGENGFSRSEVILIGAGLGGVPGGLLGALLGAVAKKEVWWKVPM